MFKFLFGKRERPKLVIQVLRQASAKERLKFSLTNESKRTVHIVDLLAKCKDSVEDYVVEHMQAPDEEMKLIGFLGNYPLEPGKKLYFEVRDRSIEWPFVEDLYVRDYDGNHYKVGEFLFDPEKFERLERIARVEESALPEPKPI